MKIKRNAFLIITLIISFIMCTQYVFAAKLKGSAPLAPTGLNLSSITSNSINIKWNSASNASGYYIYRASTNDSNYVKIATVTTTSYTNINLIANTKYWYYVSAYNSYGTSAGSVHVSAVTLQSVTTSSPKKILGFTTYYYSGDTSSYNSMQSNASAIDEIATQTYTTDSTGVITGLIPSNQLTYANNNGIISLAMLQNNFDGNIAKSVLENPTNRQALINNITTALKTNGYKGINVDLEGVFYYDRSYYTTFVKELYNTLKPLGYIITLAVPAKTSDSPSDGWSGAYDYAALSSYSDQVVLMTYDEHYPGGTPGAVASIGWVENVVKYAVTVIPKDKIILGTAAYGYDWNNGTTKAYSINGMNNLAAANNSTILWDSISKTPYFNFNDASGISHSCWFENAQSVNYKLDLVNNYGLAGIGIWRLGLENSDYWTSIKTKFNR